MAIHLVVEEIASQLDFKDLKSCRAVNFLWKDIATKQLLKRGIAALHLNESSISSILTCDPQEFLWDSVDLDWGFGHSKSESRHYDFAEFFMKFGYHITTIRWTGADFLVAIDETNFDSDIGRQLGEYLHLLPNLENLTIGKPETSFGPAEVKQCKPVAGTLIHLSKLGVTRLTTLNLSSHAFLNPRDMKLLKDIGLRLKNFTWLGKPIHWENGLAMGELINSWSSTLEILRFSYSPDFGLGPMPVLRTFRVQFRFNLTNPLPFVEQFPRLEDMGWHFGPNFDWDLFLPAHMKPHFHIRFLDLQRNYGNISVLHYVRLMEKCPKLKFLTTSAIEDEVASAIFKNLPDLEFLDTIPACSHVTFTGVDDPYDMESSASDILNPTRISIRKLTKLRDVIIRGHIDDVYVWFGLSLLDNLEKLVLPQGVSDLTLRRFMTHAPKLHDLTLTNETVGFPFFQRITKDGLNMLLDARPQLLINLVQNFSGHP